MSYQYPTLGLNTIQMNTLAFPSSINNDNLNMNITKDEEKKEIIHTVNQCDTLIGISLQYNVPLERIKIYNNLHTEDIYFLKELRIPNPCKIIKII